MMSEKGNAILEKLWVEFRCNYPEDNPGSNLNDAERAFLELLNKALFLREMSRRRYAPHHEILVAQEVPSRGGMLRDALRFRGQIADEIEKIR